MKIILGNKYFFINGGTEKYLADLMPQLSNAGHLPIPFSVRYSGSWPSPFSRYFLPPPGDPQHVRLQHIRLSPLNWLRYLDRSIYSLEAKVYLKRLLKSLGEVDIAYLLNIYNYMSPSIIHTLHRNRIPVVMQLGDYNLLCPSYSFLRDGRPCTLCIQGDYYHGLRYCCVKNNILASTIRAGAMYVHKWLKIYDRIAAFVVPCRFMASKLIEGGFPAARIHLIPYPVSGAHALQSKSKKDYIFYFGRISYEKGLDTLINAFQRLKSSLQLLIAGRSYDNEIERLQGLIRPEFHHRIRFLGFKSGSELSHLIADALLSVVPSRWYDNAPISIYESFLHATPVAGADIGGIPEQIQEGITGRLFKPDATEHLATVLKEMLADHGRLIEMGQAARKYVLENMSIAKHTDRLLELFQTVLQQA